MTTFRIILAVAQAIFLGAELIITFVLMRMLPPFVLLSWIYSFIAIIGFFLVFWDDTVMSVIFAIIYHKCQLDSLCVTIASIIFVGNPHKMAR